jgi:hypothetical protein
VLDRAIFVFVWDVSLWRHLIAWSAARDFWWIARRESLLQLSIKLVFNFFAFALLACLSLFRHIVLRLAGLGPGS